MKKMTCNQLGGACDKEFLANSFEEIGEMSKEHAMQMLGEQDPAHLEAMGAMQELMQEPAKMQEWFQEKRQEFEALPEQ